MATIRKLPSGKWNAQIRKRGRSPVSKTFRTKAAADDWARNIETEYDKGSYKDFGQADRVTLSELMQRYKDTITPRKKSARREISRMKVLDAEFGHLSISSITPEKVSTFITKRLQTVGPVTVKKDIITLSLILDAGELWGIHLQTNPVRTAKKIMRTHGHQLTENPRERRLIKWEIKRLLKASAPPLKSLIIWAIESAMRRGEIANMKKTHRTGNTIKIPDTKTGKPRSIPMTRHMRKAWANLPLGITDDAISKSFSRACKRAGITDLRFHDLRHEAASRLFEKGLQMHEVAAITGHADWASLKRYTHPDIDKLREKLGG